MNLGNSSSDYLTYKKSRMNPGRVQRVEKRIEKVKRIAKLSLVTFCIMFVFVVIFIKKYAKRVDIEYGRNGAAVVKEDSGAGFSDNYYDNDKRTIDKRLLLIQEEENAPSESRVLPQDRDKNEVMNLEHFEKLKLNAEAEDPGLTDSPAPKKVEEPKPASSSTNTQQTASKANILPKIPTGSTGSVNVEQQGVYAPIELPRPANIKVLIGKYSTFDEAKNAQNAMKNSSARVAPFIRKVDNVYCLQVGSYAGMDVARGVAGTFAKEGYDVWIYQQ